MPRMTLPEKTIKVWLVSEDDGVTLQYSEEYRHVYMSPLRIARQFSSWSEAVNFLKMWDATEYIQWW